MIKGSMPDYRLVKSFAAEDNSTLYVFDATNSERFIVVSADDAVTPLLGYSDNGAFDLESASPEFLWMLGEYSRQIEQARELGITSSAQASRDRAPVAPLVKTKWNQDAPYYNKCPMLGTNRCYVGCVATAVAQVVNYFRCPADHGTGIHTYNWNGRELSFDYENTSFDWPNMASEYPYNPDDYPGSVSEIDDALATLSYACGVGVDMIYSPSASGAYSYRVPEMLSEHFGFDIGFSYLKRDFYGYNEWNDIVYAEVAAGRPVLYSGMSDGGGHEFICDGYSDNDLFHINWGWGGMCDGYYLLAVLDPDSQGIGGSTTGNGFTESQDIVIGLQPAREDSAPTVPMYSYGSLTPEYDETMDSYVFTFSYGETAAYFFSAKAMNLYIGLRIEDTDGNSTYCHNDDIVTINAIGEDLRLPEISLITAPYKNLRLTPGTYKVFPAVRAENGNWQDILPYFGLSRYCFMEVMEDGSYKFEEAPSDVVGKLVVHDIRVRTPGSGNTAPVYAVDLENTGENVYSKDVTLEALSPESEETLSSTVISLSIGALSDFSQNIRWNACLPEGEYDFVIKEDGVIVGDKFRIHIDAVDYPEIEVSRIEIPANFPTDIRSIIEVELANTGTADYKDPIYLYVYEPDGNTPVTVMDFMARIDAGATLVKEIKWMPEIADGAYEIEFRNGNSQFIGGRYDISVGQNSGIAGTVAGEAAIETFDLYTMDGRCVGRKINKAGLLQMSPGIYIMHSGSTVTKIAL